MSCTPLTLASDTRYPTIAIGASASAMTDQMLQREAHDAAPVPSTRPPDALPCRVPVRDERQPEHRRNGTRLSALPDAEPPSLDLLVRVWKGLHALPDGERP